MPGVYRQGDINSVLQQAFQRLRALETQQQQILSNLQGLSVMAFGLIPGSNPQRYGLEAVDPNTGGATMFAGYSSGTDTSSIQFFDAAGNVTSEFDQTGLHFYDGTGTERSRIDVDGTHYYGSDGHELVLIDDTGLHVYNDTGAEEVAAGQISVTPPIYGLGVAPATGSTPGGLQQVGGTLQVFPPDVASVSNTTYADFGSPSLITAEIGPSGQADVFIGAEISTSAGGVGGVIGLSVDGAAMLGWVTLQSDAGAVTGNSSGTVPVSGLAAGTHTFQLGYAKFDNGAPGTVSFSIPAMSVQPL